VAVMSPVMMVMAMLPKRGRSSVGADEGLVDVERMGVA
jgi:hypothetical protein